MNVPDKSPPTDDLVMTVDRSPMEAYGPNGAKILRKYKGHGKYTQRNGIWCFISISDNERLTIG